jgi:hypothetical protein
VILGGGDLGRAAFWEEAAPVLRVRDCGVRQLGREELGVGRWCFGQFGGPRVQTEITELNLVFEDC